MAERVFFQRFSDFRGLDVQSSELTRPPNFAKELINFAIASNFSLVGRKGFKTHADVFDGEACLGIHNYIYKDVEDGATKEEIIAVGKTLYRLVEVGDFTIDYTGLNTWTVEFLLDTVTSTYKFKLTDGGSTVLTYDVGNGLEDPNTGSPKLLSDLETQIDGVTDFTATLDSTISSSLATIFPLVSGFSTTDASYTWKIAYWEEVSHFPTDEEPFTSYYLKHRDPTWKPPVMINKENVVYIACGAELPLLKYDGVQLLRAGNYPILKEIVDLTLVTGSSTLTGTYSYYIRNKRIDAKGNVVYGEGDIITPTTQPSAQDVEIDLAASFVLPSGNVLTVDRIGAAITSTGGDEALDILGHDRLKIGDMVYTDGSPVEYRKVTSIDKSTWTIGVDQAVSGTVNRFAYYEWDLRRDTTTTTGTNISSVTISAANTFRVGEWVFLDQMEAWFKVVDNSTTTLELDGIFTISSGTTIITNISMEVYRTQDGGVSSFYLVKEVPSLIDASTTFTDDVADADLGALLTLPDKEPSYLRNYPSVITEHQGLVMAGGFNFFPDRMYYEDSIFTEGFPQAFNFIDIPSQDAGLITAIWSDTFDQLAVFKDTAYYSIVGEFSLASPNLTLTKSAENDIGIASQNSLVKIRGVNLGISDVGFVAFQGGEINFDFTKFLDSEFLEAQFGAAIDQDTRLRLLRSHSVNDYIKQQVIFFVPALYTDTDANNEATSLYGANDNSKIFIFDYSDSAWGRWQLPGDVSTSAATSRFMPAAGMTMHKNELFMMSNAVDEDAGAATIDEHLAYLFKRQNNAVSDIKHDYADQHSAIDYEYWSPWETGDMPGMNKVFDEVKFYVLNQDNFTPFTLRVRAYKNWDTTTTVYDKTYSFSDTTKREAVFRLGVVKARALSFRVTTSSVQTAPTITGYEYTVGSSHYKRKIK